jgi:Uma2 family endonuclease
MGSRPAQFCLILSTIPRTEYNYPPERSQAGDPDMNPIIPPFPLPAEYLPDYDRIVTEDDTPVDSILSEKQQRFLADQLYSSWPGPGEGRPFLALGNVGLFFAAYEPPLVPDFMLSLDVRAPQDLWPKENRSYFCWVYGKTPDVALEFVSNREGGEADSKLRAYARMSIPYHGIFDPADILGEGVWRFFSLVRRSYEPANSAWLPEVGLGLKLWQGSFEGVQAQWLRWCDRQGQMLLTGAERAERLAAQLRALGIEPSA